MKVYTPKYSVDIPRVTCLFQALRIKNGVNQDDPLFSNLLICEMDTVKNLTEATNVLKNATLFRMEKLEGWFKYESE